VVKGKGLLGKGIYKGEKFLNDRTLTLFEKKGRAEGNVYVYWLERAERHPGGGRRGQLT